MVGQLVLASFFILRRLSRSHILSFPTPPNTIATPHGRFIKFFLRSFLQSLLGQDSICRRKLSAILVSQRQSGVSAILVR